MISSERLIQQLTATNFKKIALPKSDRFTQCDCYEAKKREMDLAIRNVDAVNRATDYPNLSTAAPVVTAMETAYSAMMLNNVDGMLATEKLSTATIDFDTYMNFTENELLGLPEVVQRIVKQDAGKTLDRVKIYGFKNPESFYKSLILVRTPEFATQTKFNRTQTIMKFKRELAFGANEIHRSHGYHRLLDPVFKLDQIVRNLIDRETYVDNGICQLACDFVKRSIIVFDVIGKKYSVFRHRPSVSSDQASELGPTYLLINYNGAYSPCIYVDTHNTFDGQALAMELAKQYEHTNQDMYKLNEKDTEPKAPKKPERSANAEPRLDLLLKKIEDRERDRKVTVVTECPMGTPSANASEPSPTEVVSEPSANASAPPSSANASECPMDRSTSAAIASSEPSPTEVVSEPSAVETASEPSPTTNSASTTLGPIKNYTLEQLQALATEHGIETTRPNAKGNPVRKTKQVLYDELTGQGSSQAS
jgi:hypothetical protein